MRLLAKSSIKENENENENEKLCSLDNLLCYLALREQNLTDLQMRLAEDGLASLAMSENNVQIVSNRFSNTLESSQLILVAYVSSILKMENCS